MEEGGGVVVAPAPGEGWAAGVEGASAFNTLDDGGLPGPGPATPPEIGSREVSSHRGAEFMADETCRRRQCTFKVRVNFHLNSVI